jgi:hypothetical protein
MFGDWEWDSDRYRAQAVRYRDWLGRLRGRRVTAVEVGAGLAIPTVRVECEERGQVLIRVNPREAETPVGGISLPLGALEGLERIDALLGSD